jgi:hypothetical protein
MPSKGKKLSKKEKRQHQEKECLREQREAASRAPKGADPAGSAQNPGLCTFNFF